MKRLILVTAGLMAALMMGSVCMAENPVVVMKTSMGTIEIELYENEAPITVAITPAMASHAMSASTAALRT